MTKKTPPSSNGPEIKVVSVCTEWAWGKNKPKRNEQGVRVVYLGPLCHDGDFVAELKTSADEVFGSKNGALVNGGVPVTFVLGSTSEDLPNAMWQLIRGQTPSCHIFVNGKPAAEALEGIDGLERAYRVPEVVKEQLRRLKLGG